MTSSSDSITPEEIENMFERCPHCGTYAIQITDSHYCDSRFTSNLSDAERDQRIVADPYPSDKTIAIVDQLAGDAFAYHEPDADNQPVCTLNTDSPLEYYTRADPQDDQHALCQRCQRLHQNREADQ